MRMSFVDGLLVNNHGHKHDPTDVRIYGREKEAKDYARLYRSYSRAHKATVRERIIKADTIWITTWVVICRRDPVIPQPL